MNNQNLTDTLMEKARACKTSEELSALAAEVGVELSDDELEGVAGGSWATDCSKEDCDDYGQPDDDGDCPQYKCYSYGFM